jgi:hypothetical protein
MTPWVQNVESIVIYVFVALSAAVVVLTAAISAPLHRRKVAWAAFFVGATLAVVLAVVSGQLLSLVVAILAGLITAILVGLTSRRLTDRSNGRATSGAPLG